jgi:hypothetical protein
MGRRHPDSAAGKPFLEVGDDFAVWREDEADQALLWQALTREGAAADGIFRLKLGLKLWLSAILSQRHFLLEGSW